MDIDYLIKTAEFILNNIKLTQLIFLLLPLLFSFFIFGIGFFFCKLFRFKQRFTKKVFILITIFIYLLSFLFIYSLATAPKKYSIRSKVTEAVAFSAEARLGLQEWYLKYGTFESIKITDISKKIEGKYVENVWLSIPEDADEGTIVIYAKMRSTKEVDDAIKGKIYTLEIIDGGKTWSCGAKAKYRHENFIDNKYLPSACKP